MQKKMTQTINRIKAFFKIIGPGVITGASDDDPSGIATYSQAGSQFGLHTLRTALISFPLMAAIQEMCGRIGLITKHGIAGVIKRHYSPRLMYAVALITIPACIMNISADLSGIGAVSNMVFPQIPAPVYILIFTLIIFFSIIFFSYKKFSSIMKWLTITLFMYFIIPFLVHGNNLREILKSSIVPYISRNKDFLMIIVAILGTTISPYLFFREASEEVEEEAGQISEAKANHKKMISIPKREKLMQEDNFVGMLFSQVAMYFIILTAGTVLFRNGITNISTVQDVAAALRPLAGNASYLLFAFGVIGTGMLAIPVLAGACAYIVSETLNRPGGINMDRKKGRSFYLVIIVSVLLGGLINILGISPIKMLIWSAVLYGIVAAPLIGVILHICNNEKIMGKFVNGRLSNILGIIGMVLMAASALAFILL